MYDYYGCSSIQKKKSLWLLIPSQLRTKVEDQFILKYPKRACLLKLECWHALSAGVWCILLECTFFGVRYILLILHYFSCSHLERSFGIAWFSIKWKGKLSIWNASSAKHIWAWTWRWRLEIIPYHESLGLDILYLPC